MIKFTVPGKPKVLKRHRSGKRGNYDPSRDDKRIFAIHCNQHRPKEPFDFPLHVYLQFHFDNHQHEGDVDNYVKFVFDALEKQFWINDKWIYWVTAVKVYKGSPRTEIVIKEAE